MRYRGTKPEIERYRWMVRAYVEFHLEFCRILMRVFGADIEKAYIFEAAASLSGDIVFFPAAEGEDAFGPEFTASALAKDLGLPRETVRRKLNSLTEDGFAVKAGGGTFRLPAGIVATAAFRMASDAIAVQIKAFLSRCLAENYIALQQVTAAGIAVPVADAHVHCRLVASDIEGGSHRLRQLFSGYFVASYRSRMPFFDNDLERALVFDIIGIYVVEPFYNSPKHRELTASVMVVIGEHQVGATARWIGDNVGLPRETVRRKLSKLVETGLLSITPDGRYVYRTGLFRDRSDILDGLRTTERLNIEFFNTCLQHGVFRILTIAN